MLKAERSSFSRRILQFVLSYAIPFNRPHGFRIVEVFPDGFHISLPYWRINRNHIKGIHACALATLSEYVSGLTLMKVIGRNDLRIIMKDLKMTYHFQAKKNVSAISHLTPETLERNIFTPLKTQDSVFYLMKIEVYDTDQNHICTGEINWQLKKWDKVRTV
jgi:acyl-coenzyme A thioesterase PaaI-like protein